jgi:ribosome-associated protein
MEERDRAEDRSERLARLCAQVLDESKMGGIRLLRVEGTLQITDYFVVASGRSPRHVKAATDELMRRLREEGASRRGLEGYREGKWVLLDFFEVVVHLFVEESRQFYDLENLWGDCPRLEWAAELPPAASPGLAAARTPAGSS